MPHRTRSSSGFCAPSLFLAGLLLVLATAMAPPAAAAELADEERRKRLERRLYVGMWTVHLREFDRGIDANHLIGVSLGRYYAGTFMNSFDKRAYTAGVQGTVVRWEPGPLGVHLGYRAGLVTGYDERFIALAGKTPVLPLLHPRLNLDVRRVGVEFTYSGVIASAALNARF